MISVIIPAYNEEKRILPTLDAILKVMEASGTDFELLVVDDGSRDRTKELVKGLGHEKVKLLSYENNRGKGGAVKFGVEHAKGEYIVFTDADLPYPPKNILKASEKLSCGADVVLGRRVMSEDGEAYPWYRTLMSHTFGLFVRIVLGIKEGDTQCGFKAFCSDKAKKIFKQITLSGWGFDVEMIFLAEKTGCKIERLDVELSHENSDSKIRIVKDTLDMIGEVLAVRKNQKQGKYQF